MYTNRFPTNYVVATIGVRSAEAISRKVLAKKHAQAMEGLGLAMTTPEVERWIVWAQQWPFTREQRADIRDARAAAEYDIAFDAAKAAARRPATAQA